ncbi:MAG: RsmE family RNA methyltransferase [Flavobacteriaceae bacterium]
MTLFFDSHITVNTKSFELDLSESKHISKVLRKKVGDNITVTNGKGLEWNGKLSYNQKNRLIATRQIAIEHKKELSKIQIAIAPTKSNHRMEWLVEKLTEIGVDRITPVLCERSERKILKTERLIKIAITALKQSNNFFLPKIDEIIKFDKFLENNQNPILIAHCSPRPSELLVNYKFNFKKISLLIGPEGDFSNHEIEKAISLGHTAVSLGNQRYRTETAGVLGCHLLHIQQQQNKI